MSARSLVGETSGETAPPREGLESSAEEGAPCAVQLASTGEDTCFVEEQDGSVSWTCEEDIAEEEEEAAALRGAQAAAAGEAEGRR